MSNVASWPLPCLSNPFGASNRSVGRKCSRARLLGGYLSATHG